MHKAPLQSFPRIATKAQAAEFFETSLPTVDAWIRKGAPVVGRGRKGVGYEIDLRAMAEWLYGGGRAGDAEGENDPDKMNPIHRKAWFESEHKRRDLQVKDGELIPRADVELVVSTAFAAVAQAALAIPDRLERSYAVPAKITALVEQGITECLGDLETRIAKLAPVDQPDAEAA